MDITGIPIPSEIWRYKKRKKIVKYFMSVGMPRNMAEKEAQWIKFANKYRYKNERLKYTDYKNEKRKEKT